MDYQGIKLSQPLLPWTESLVQFGILVCRIILAYCECIFKFFKTEKKKSINGQNVLITGSGHGLGRELALKFAKQGANLILVDINEVNNENVRQEISQLYPELKTLTYSIDIRDENEVALMAEKIKRLLGDKCVDILVNNAGIVQCRSFFDLSPQLVERTFQVNCLAHIWMVRHFLPMMIKQKRGHIVAVSSIGGLIGAKYITDYCASKFAVVGLMEALELEIHDGDNNENIHFTTVCPASMSTGMFKNFTSRFSWLLPVLNAEQVASCIMDAILTNQARVVIPQIALFFYRLSYFLPHKVRYLVQDYLDYGVKPHTN